MLYLIETQVSNLPQNHQIICVAGTPFGWVEAEGDRSYEVPKGMEVFALIDTLPIGANEDWISMKEMHIGKPQVFVSTRLSLEACVAAAALQLPAWSIFDTANQCENIDYLRLVALSLQDRLGRVQDLRIDEAVMGEFAASLISEAFKLTTQWLIEAVLERVPWEWPSLQSLRR